MLSARIKKIIFVDDLLINVLAQVREPSEDTLFIFNNLVVTEVRSALFIGCGAGLIPLQLANLGIKVLATDINPMACKTMEINARINGLENMIDVAYGSCYEPVQGKFDLILSSPPQLPTPAECWRDDWIGQANNGGISGHEIMNEIIEGAHNHLNHGGRITILHLDVISLEDTLETFKKAGYRSRIIATKEKEMGKISFERMIIVKGSINRRTYTLNLLEGQRE